MQQLQEKVLLAKWKSYKIFKPSGKINLHTQTIHKEFHFTEDRLFTLKEFNNTSTETITKTDKWILYFDNRHHFIKIASEKLVFEIITVNHTVMVLLEISTRDKIFLSKEDFWQDHLNSNSQKIMRLTAI